MTMKLFVTGTDTHIGKTVISTGLLNLFKKNKYSTLGIKPVASGCIRHNGHLQNEDALLLQEASSIQLHYHQINPFAFEPPIAPHVAAYLSNREMTVQSLKQKTQYALQYPADICLTEGVGGWYVPLNQTETMADYVKATSLKTLLVVGIRLGCINHALLTYRAIREDSVNVVGWIANVVDPSLHYYQESIHALKQWLPIPCIGVVDYQKKVEDVVDIDNLIQAYQASCE